VREWVPVPGTAKGRLVSGALSEFGRRGYAAVSVTELAELAGVTIGSLYHHFRNKTGLYNAVREDVERRVLDRMEGAAAVRPGDPAAALLVGFDYLVGAGFARLLAEPHPERTDDPVEALLATLTGEPLRARILLAAWQAALAAAADEPSVAVRAALQRVLGHSDSPH
jgi:AcrR family transcriptional regulator